MRKNYCDRCGCEVTREYIEDDVKLGIYEPPRYYGFYITEGALDIYDNNDRLEPVKHPALCKDCVFYIIKKIAGRIE